MSHKTYAEVMQEWIEAQSNKSYSPKQELPVIPQFVADWIERNKQFEEKWNDYSKEDAMNDTIHFTIYGLFADYPATNSDIELRKPVLKWLRVDRGNYFKLVNAVRYGYEVEEEPKYIIDTDDIEISDGNHYLTNLTLSKDSVKLPIVGDKFDAIRFDDINQAQAIASYVGGRVEECDYLVKHPPSLLSAKQNPGNRQGGAFSLSIDI